VLTHIFERGKAIFEDELNFSSEIELLNSAILPEIRIKLTRDMRDQIMLRLILRGDKAFLAGAIDQAPNASLRAGFEKIHPIWIKGYSYGCS